MFVSFFEAEDLTFLTVVLERACSDIGPLDESRRQAIAARILHLAQTGERDFEALRKYAMASNLGRRRLPRLDQIFLGRRFSVADAVWQ